MAANPTLDNLLDVGGARFEHGDGVVRVRGVEATQALRLRGGWRAWRR